MNGFEVLSIDNGDFEQEEYNKVAKDSVKVTPKINLEKKKDKVLSEESLTSPSKELMKLNKDSSNEFESLAITPFRGKIRVDEKDLKKNNQIVVKENEMKKY